MIDCEDPIWLIEAHLGDDWKETLSTGNKAGQRRGQSLSHARLSVQYVIRHPDMSFVIGCTTFAICLTLSGTASDIAMLCDGAPFINFSTGSMRYCRVLTTVGGVFDVE